ncbi:MAG: TolC family protein [Verrucomicrobium sp.]|nr:TolC family protein [Verrucomicrobium sp.]
MCRRKPLSFAWIGALLLAGTLHAADLTPNEGGAGIVSTITPAPDVPVSPAPTVVSYPENQITARDENPDLVHPPVDGPSLSSRPVYTLRDCLDLALRQNPDLLIAKKGIEGAAGGVIEARAAFLPQLSTSGLYQKREQGTLTSTQQDPNLRDENWYVTLRLTENVFSAGENTSRMRMARLAQSSKMLGYQAAVDDVLLRVRLAYYELLLAQSNIEVRRQAVDLLDQQLKAEEDRYKAGLTSQTSVLRAQVSRANELPSLLEAENRLLNGYVKLSQLLNIPYQPSSSAPPFAVTGSLGYDPRAYSLADCLAKAVSSRPELRVQANNVESQEKQLIVDRSALLPRVDLFLGYDFTSDPARSDLNSYNDGYVAGVSGSWAIFDGLATTGRMRQTRAKIAAAKMSRTQARLGVEAEVRQAFNTLAQAASTVESQIKNVVQARESYVLSQASYEAGLATQLDVLQSRVDLTTAQTTEFQARYDYLAATANLQRALSSQFQIVNDNLPPPAPATEPLAAPSASAAPDQAQGPAQAPPQSAASGMAAPSFPPPSTPLPPLPTGADVPITGPAAIPALPPMPGPAPMPPPSLAPTPTSPMPTAPPPPSSVPSPLAPPGAAPSTPFGSSFGGYNR